MGSRIQPEDCGISGRFAWSYKHLYEGPSYGLAGTPLFYVPGAFLESFLKSRTQASGVLKLPGNQETASTSLLDLNSFLSSPGRSIFSTLSLHSGLLSC